MDDSQRGEFATVISAVLESHGQGATKPRLHGYWLALVDLDLPSVERAGAEALRTMKRVPSPAELRELATGGSREGRAVIAWGCVQKSVSVSYMHDLDFEDRVINRAIRLLGGRSAFYERLNGGAESEKWLRIEFLKTYCSVCENAGDEFSDVLVGEAERGDVCGRSGKPRLAVIATSGRMRIGDASESRRVASRPNASNRPLVEFRKV